MEARFKKAGLFVFTPGPAGTARVAGDGLLLAYDDGPSAAIRFADLKKAGFNSNNGLWTFHPKQGKKLVIRTTGRFFSVGDRAAGHRFNEALASAIERHGVKTYAV